MLFFFLILATVQSLGLNSETSCNFLACSFSATLKPIINVINIILLLPFVIIYSLTVNFWFIQIAGVLSIIWFFAFPLLLTVIYHTLMHKGNPIKKENPDLVMFDLCMTVLIVAFIGFFLLGFLFYPKIVINNVNFTDYAILATLEATMLAISIQHMDKNKQKLARKLGMVSIMFLVLGMCMTILYSNIQNTLPAYTQANYGTPTTALLTLGTTNGLELSTIVAGVFGILVNLMFLMELDSPNKKNSRKRKNFISKILGI